MKKILSILVLSLLFCGSAYTETWTCDNFRHGKAMYEVKDTEIILSFTNNDGITFKITKDQRQYKISVYGEFSDNHSDFDFDIYMDYGGKYVINRTQDALSGYSKSYTDKNCVIFH